MRLPTVKHEDGRRTLIEYINDIPIRTSKVLYVKEDSTLGKHFHKLKDDVFFMVKGSGFYKLDGKRHTLKEGDCIFVKAGVRHTFTLKAGSVLIESSTTPYDKKDEYPI